jgi:hypothetical protein
LATWQSLTVVERCWQLYRATTPITRTPPPPTRQQVSAEMRAYTEENPHVEHDVQVQEKGDGGGGCHAPMIDLAS